MALDDIERFDRFRTLDSGAFVDGWFRDAYVCRSVSQAMNTLARKGHPLLHLLFSARSVVGEGNVRALYAPASLVYQRLTPGGAWLRPKKSGFDRGTLRVLLQVPTDQVVQIQVETLRNPLQPDARLDSGRVLEVVGTGARSTHELAGIPLDPGPMERIIFWIRAIPTTLTPGSVAAHTVGGAGANVGRVGSITLTGNLDAVTPPANSWRASSAGDSWATDHFLLIHDGPNAATIGNTLFQGQIILVDGPDSLWAWPPQNNPINARRLLNRYFGIFELPVVRIFGLDLEVDDRP